jgi:hypothetical protein
MQGREGKQFRGLLRYWEHDPDKRWAEISMLESTLAILESLLKWLRGREEDRPLLGFAKPCVVSRVKPTCEDHAAQMEKSTTKMIGRIYKTKNKIEDRVETCGMSAAYRNAFMVQLKALGHDRFISIVVDELVAVAKILDGSGIDREERVIALIQTITERQHGIMRWNEFLPRCGAVYVSRPITVNHSWALPSEQ